jgi:hypothetical protein
MEIDALMKKSGASMLEAAEALEKCSFQPRKALQVRVAMTRLLTAILVCSFVITRSRKGLECRIFSVEIRKVSYLGS